MRPADAPGRAIEHEGTRRNSWTPGRFPPLLACRTCSESLGSEKALIAAHPKISFPKAADVNEPENRIHTEGKSFRYFSQPASEGFCLREEIGYFGYAVRLPPPRKAMNRHANTQRTVFLNCLAELKFAQTLWRGKSMADSADKRPRHKRNGAKNAHSGC